jgi:hypothetical protein
MDLKDLREHIELEAKSTIGYSEAENKQSFMVGVSVTFSKTSEHYEREIKKLNNQIENYKFYNGQLTSDLKTLASIINRYSDND